MISKPPHSQPIAELSMDMLIGLSSSNDKAISKKLSEQAQKRPFEEVAQTFPAYVRRQLITRFLAYYELFKLVQDTPGWIVECGVYRGFSFFSLARFLEIFCMGDKTRKVLGFDSFAGFKELSDEDGPENAAVTRSVGGANPAGFRDEFYDLMDALNNDAFAPWAPRAQMIEGDVTETIPKYLESNPGLRISLLHLDIDLYKPVSVALQHLYPRVVPGGVVVLDEFAHHDWPGESQALQDVFSRNNWPVPKLKTFGWVGTPTTYFVKETW
jgi:hypothetical protein